MEAFLLLRDDLGFATRWIYNVVFLFYEKGVLHYLLPKRYKQIRRFEQRP